MKIITRGVIDWSTGAVLEEDSYEYSGPVAHAKDSGSPPQAVDPYQQAAAQYGLSTGTALFNAGLNRTNQVNPLGSTTWSASYPNGNSTGPAPPQGGNYLGLGGNQTGAPSPPQSTSGYSPPTTGNSASGPGAQFSTGPSTIPFGGIGNGFTGIPYGLGPGSIYARGPYNGSPTGSPTGGAPSYTQTTQLAPQFESQLEKPIDTSGLAGMPGGPSTTQDLANTRSALFAQQEQYIQPEQQLQTEQLQSQLANEGLAPGSAAYGNEMDRLNREQTFTNSNAINQAITGGGAEQSRLFSLGSQSLQDQLAARNAPISEWAALSGTGGASAQALTPDISGAFNQQLQAQTAGYNANTASNNATTEGIGSLALAAALYF